VVDFGATTRGFLVVLGHEKWKVKSGVVDGRDAWVGDRWLPPLAGDAWRTAVTPDAGHWLPVRGRETVRNELERERSVGGVRSEVPDFDPPFCSTFLFFWAQLTSFN